MNENIAQGTARDIGGTVKQVAGAALDRPDIEAEGKGDQLGGRAQKAAGHAQAAVEDIAAPLIDFVRRQPLVALGVAGVIGYLLFGTRKN